MSQAALPSPVPRRPGRLAQGRRVVLVEPAAPPIATPEAGWAAVAAAWLRCFDTNRQDGKDVAND